MFYIEVRNSEWAQHTHITIFNESTLEIVSIYDQYNSSRVVRNILHCKSRALVAAL